jgi:hypothetical protein
MTFDLLRKTLGEPADRGERSMSSESWRSAGEESPRAEYAIWDCNGCLQPVRQGERALDALAVDRSGDDDVTLLRGVLARMLAVSCCMAARSTSDEHDWFLVGACAKHGSVFSR